MKLAKCESPADIVRWLQSETASRRIVIAADACQLAEATLLRDLQVVAGVLGVQLQVLHASAERDFDTAFFGPTAGRRARDRHRSVFGEPERTARRIGAPPRGAHDLL
jgi:hypothetical protein